MRCVLFYFGLFMLASEKVPITLSLLLPWISFSFDV